MRPAKTKNHKCQKCSSKRILRAYGKVTDSYCSVYNGKEIIGYVPPNVPWCDSWRCQDGTFVADTDNIGFLVCLDCGQMQGEWPVQDKDLGEEEENS